MFTIRRYSVALSIFAIGVYVFANTAFALDLGGMLKQVQKAVQPEANQTTQAQPTSGQNSVDNMASANAAGESVGSDPCKVAEENKARQPGQSMQDYLEQGNRKKAAKAACEAKQMAKATEPEYVETSEPLEIKGIKIGMTEQDLLKLLPQGFVIRPKPQTGAWVNGDAIVQYGSGTAVCDRSALERNRLGTNCNPFVIMGKMAYTLEMYFFDNKLAYGEVHFDRRNAVESNSRFAEDNEHFFDELLEGLSTKFKATPKSKNTKKGRDNQYRTVGWKGSACQCEIVVLDDNGYTEPSNEVVMIKFMSDEYPSIFESRTKIALDAEAKEKNVADAKIKGDL